MKRTNQTVIILQRTMKNLKQLLTLGAAICGLTASAQDTIVYVNGPSFPFPYQVEPADAALDLNGDGAPDFSFQLGYFVTTFGCGYLLSTNWAVTGPLICGGAIGPYYVWGLGTNSTLFQQFINGTVLPFGTFIGDPPPTNAAWGNPELSVTIASLFIGQPSQTGLYGPLANVGVGYLGVRFHAVDGVHYGWIRLRS